MLRAQRRFFCDLDWATNPCALRLQPELPDLTLRLRAVTELPAVLRARVLARARAGRAPNWIPPVGLPRTDAALTKHVSAVLEACIRHHFPGVHTAAGANRAVLAFVHFASGLLRHDLGGGHWVCEPNGPYYFFFAEFAWAALEHGAGQELWPQILHGLISSQFLYVHTYYDSSSLVPRTFEQASRDHAFAAERVPAPRLRELWTSVNATRSTRELEYESCRRAAELLR
ncbi:MAG: hypothetical protein JNK02_03815 [Planctomycetes bacterium]|nr:hypothetical protein [Planctomycetota bacterium]